MIEYIWQTASDRKRRLFVGACADLVIDQLPTGQLRDAPAISERLADGLASEEDRLRLVRLIYSIPVVHFHKLGTNWFHDISREARSNFFAALTSVAQIDGPSSLISRLSWQEGRFTTGDRQPDLLRELFGNPFQNVAIEPKWQTAQVVTLSRAIYDQKAFDQMPDLAATLQKAGCHADLILNHCRAPGPHVRGCWVLDLLLGRS